MKNPTPALYCATEGDTAECQYGASDLTGWTWYEFSVARPLANRTGEIEDLRELPLYYCYTRQKLGQCQHRCFNLIQRGQAYLPTYLRLLLVVVFLCGINSALIVPVRHVRYSSHAMLSLYRIIKVSRILVRFFI